MELQPNTPCLSEVSPDIRRGRPRCTPVSTSFHVALPQLTLDGILMRAIVEARQSGLRITAAALHVALGVMMHEASDNQKVR